MAKFTEVPNTSLCPGCNKSIRDWYIDAVEEFADKYGKGSKSTITIPTGYEKWEGHVVSGTYRLDLQDGEHGYANIQAQFGLGHSNCKKGGSYGGVLMVCDTPFSIADVQTALTKSLVKGMTLIQLDVDDKPLDIVPKVNKSQKTKPGKKDWTPDTVYQ